MDVSISLDHPHVIFTNGDTISGNVTIYSPTNTTKISKIIASLVGESVLTLTDKMGLLMDRKQQDRHRFAHEVQILLPSRYTRGGSNGEDHVRLGLGYHKFRFELKLPETAECYSCPPNSPVLTSADDEKRSTQTPFSSRNTLPPSMQNVVKGVTVSYRIDIAVTSVHSIFKSTTKNSQTITVWPQDGEKQSLTHALNTCTAFPCVKTIEAAIMAPYPNNIPFSLGQSLSPDLSPAHVFISAHFPPNASPLQNRHLAMRLSISKQTPFPHDLYLQSFQMLLVGYTIIKVGALPASTDTQTSCWTIQSVSNLGLPVLRGFEDVGVEREIDRAFWEGDRLPDVIVPTFEGCGVRRRYEVCISLGLQCRGAKDQAGRVLFVQLRTPVLISSGIPHGRRLDGGAQTRLAVGEDFVPRAYENARMRQHGEARQLQCGGDDGGLPLDAPPTYEEATMVSR